MTTEIAICVRVGADRAPLILASTKDIVMVRHVVTNALGDAAAKAAARDPRVRADARNQVKLLTSLLGEIGDHAATAM